MKTPISSICIALCLALGSTTQALADRGHDRGYHRPAHPSFFHARPAPQRHHGHHRNYGWAGPAAVLAITGIAAGIAASTYYAPAYVAPQPVYVTPASPRYAMPLAGYWNYCMSAGQYYPNVTYCAEGWQPVDPR